MHEKQNLVAGQLFPLAILILTAHPQIASLRPSAAAPWFCVDPLLPRRATRALSRAGVQNVDISSNLCRLHKVEMRSLDQYRPLIKGWKEVSPVLNICQFKSRQHELPIGTTRHEAATIA